MRILLGLLLLIFGSGAVVKHYRDEQRQRHLQLIEAPIANESERLRATSASTR